MRKTNGSANCSASSNLRSVLLDGKVVIVTGGSRGIGRDVCRVLARHGAKVAVVYTHSEDKARVSADEAGNGALPFRADVTKLDDWHRLRDEVLAAFGRIDAVVNGAIAGKQDGPFAKATDADFETAFDYGCRAVANSVRALRPHFAERGEGRIVNLVTEVWNMAGAGWSVYLAGKGAMVGMSRSLANELGPEGITVNMIAPGWMATDKVDTSSAGSQGFAATLPLRRHGSGEEIGNGCVFFLSELGSYVTGAYLPITGGRVTQGQ